MKIYGLSSNNSNSFKGLLKFSNPEPLVPLQEIKELYVPTEMLAFYTEPGKLPPRKCKSASKHNQLSKKPLKDETFIVIAGKMIYRVKQDVKKIIEAYMKAYGNNNIVDVDSGKIQNFENK